MVSSCDNDQLFYQRGFQALRLGIGLMKLILDLDVSLR